MTPADAWATHEVTTVWGAPLTVTTDDDDASVRVELHDVTAPEGDRFDYPVVHLPSVAVAVVVRDEQVLVLRTYRYPVGRYGYELPGGGVDPGEEPAVAAARETAEETGWSPVGPGRPLITFQPLPGGVVSTVHVHLWTEVERSDAPLDRHEPGQAQWIPVADVVRLAAAGELLGSGTLVGLLQYVAERQV
ncbi:NUDIX hydrolase [Actinomycetospora soli]|uniref:NUDIX hydrolase n=1 Tax=Actinomycetospora soli TaxID=2893887 RepID=UPI001E605A3C|nr:NUDIX hydrolase [Actinomycetospora soli]MCD2185597.1 NUDIX hydrolase [Actinomycetospora soli]